MADQRSSTTKTVVITTIIVVIILGIIYTSIPSVWTGNIACPTPSPPKKCRVEAVGKCSVKNGSCSGGMCVQALNAGAECAEGWVKETGETCNPDTCHWNP
ncbi:MAG TPA: hypothetical protein VEQ59_21295 [Polyangiaceae bacterium]|nr:hypothetical protein [Polyangiaceae bacterium]